MAPGRGAGVQRGDVQPSSARSVAWSTCWLGGRADVSTLHSASDPLLGVGLPAGGRRRRPVPRQRGPVSPCVQSVAAGHPVRTQICQAAQHHRAAYVGYGLIGFLFVVLWIPARGGLVRAASSSSRRCLWPAGRSTQYGDELKAHARTLRALVTAVETKEPHNAGHSERVAQLSEWMAEAMLLGHKEIEDIRTAGMLHDVGKVALPTRLLGSRQAHTDDDLVTIAGPRACGRRAGQGRRLPVRFRRRHRPPPRALRRPRLPRRLCLVTAIPLAARIIAVADAFECLTSARSYRPGHCRLTRPWPSSGARPAPSSTPRSSSCWSESLSATSGASPTAPRTSWPPRASRSTTTSRSVSDHIAYTDRLRIRITGREQGLHPASGEVR